MSGRRAGLALVTAVTSAALCPVAVAAPASASAVAAPGGGGRCETPAAPAEPVDDLPWAQRRYVPDRLAPFATGAGVTVAVIDSGVDDGHVQLRGRVLSGTDFLDPGRDGTVDCPGHGTAVASIIAAAPRGGVTFHGVAPRARILPVRISEQLIIDGRESGRTVTPAEFAAAIRWSVEQGADVLNLSVVLYQDDPAVRSAVEYAAESDVVVVAAAGNLHSDGGPRPYPASYPGVLGVGAIGADGLRAPFSQTGSYVDVVAPGRAVLAAVPGRGHREQDGTSYAVPFVSATAALLREYRPALSAAQVVDRIIATTDPPPATGDGAGYGDGILNPYRAVTEPGPVPPRAAPVVTSARHAPDPAVAAEQRRRARSRELALQFAGVAVGAIAVAVLLAVVLPRGARRRWRPAGSA